MILLESYLGISEDRLRHSLTVARFMYETALQEDKGEMFAREMFVLGYLHDIGFEFALDAQEHAMTGGCVLMSVGFKYGREVGEHGCASSTGLSYAGDLLNRADLSVDSEGNRVPVTQRLQNIRRRYGATSAQYESMCALAISLGMISQEEIENVGD